MNIKRIICYQCKKNIKINNFYIKYANRIFCTNNCNETFKKKYNNTEKRKKQFSINKINIIPIKTPINYYGKKNFLIPTITNIIFNNEKIKEIIELFAGSAIISINIINFCNIFNKKIDIILNDKDKDLIDIMHFLLSYKKLNNLELKDLNYLINENNKKIFINNSNSNSNSNSNKKIDIIKCNVKKFYDNNNDIIIYNKDYNDILNIQNNNKNQKLFYIDPPYKIKNIHNYYKNYKINYENLLKKMKEINKNNNLFITSFNYENETELLK